MSGSGPYRTKASVADLRDVEEKRRLREATLAAAAALCDFSVHNIDNYSSSAEKLLAAACAVAEAHKTASKLRLSPMIYTEVLLNLRHYMSPRVAKLNTAAGLVEVVCDPDIDPGNARFE